MLELSDLQTQRDTPFLSQAIFGFNILDKGFQMLVAVFQVYGSCMIVLIVGNLEIHTALPGLGNDRLYFFANIFF